MKRTVLVFTDRTGHAYQSVHLNGRTGARLYVAGRAWDGFTRSQVADEVRLARNTGARIVRRVERMA
jgi:hypothetical protein